MLIMNYHTFELSYTLTASEKDYYTDILFQTNGKTYYDRNSSMPTLVCNTVTSRGITIKLIKFEKNDFPYYALCYRINPRRIIESYDYIGLFNAKDTDMMLKKADEYLLPLKLPSVHDCRLSRIDFCANIEMSGQHEIFEYIKLLQRGRYPSNYTPSLYYDLTSKRSKHHKNSVKISHKKLLDVVYYNKYDQLKENPLCQNIDEAENILRAEIQCKKRKVKHLMDKFGCTSVRSFLKHSDKIGTYVFKQYANKFYGGGDFYKLDEIYRRIDDSKFKDKSKKKMTELAQLSAKHKSLDAALHKLDWDKATKEKILKKFDKIGVSPVVIPLRSEYDFFKNPLTLALEA